MEPLELVPGNGQGFVRVSEAGIASIGLGGRNFKENLGNFDSATSNVKRSCRTLLMPSMPLSGDETTVGWNPKKAGLGPPKKPKPERNGPQLDVVLHAAPRRASRITPASGCRSSHGESKGR